MFLNPRRSWCQEIEQYNNNFASSDTRIPRRQQPSQTLCTTPPSSPAPSSRPSGATMAPVPRGCRLEPSASTNRRAFVPFSVGYGPRDGQSLLALLLSDRTLSPPGARSFSRCRRSRGGCCEVRTARRVASRTTLELNSENATSSASSANGSSSSIRATLAPSAPPWCPLRRHPPQPGRG